MKIESMTIKTDTQTIINNQKYDYLLIINDGVDDGNSYPYSITEINEKTITTKNGSNTQEIQIEEIPYKEELKIIQEHNTKKEKPKKQSKTSKTTIKGKKEKEEKEDAKK